MESENRNVSTFRELESTDLIKPTLKEFKRTDKVLRTKGN